MKLIITDDNKKELLSTETLKEAYEFLQEQVPNQYLNPINIIRNAIYYDKRKEKQKSHFAFYLDKTEKNYIHLEVCYE